MNKEIKKNVYVSSGDKVSYGYHEKGFKTLLVKLGSVQVTANGQRFVIEEGDMVTFEPFCPYGYEVLSEDTKIRHIETDFKKFDNFISLYEPAGVKKADKRDVFFVTCRNRGRHVFEYEGIKFVNKTARYQLGGIGEIWEYNVSKEYTLNFDSEIHEEKVYFVERGTFEVKARDETYIKEGGDDEPIVIPEDTPYQITALTDDCILHNYNVKAHLFRLLEMLEAAEDYFKEKLEDKEYLNYLFEVNKLSNFIDFKKTADC